MCGFNFGNYIDVHGDRFWLPNCEKCEHWKQCYVQRRLQELSETIFNTGREMAERTDFVHNSKLLEEQAVKTKSILDKIRVEIEQDAFKGVDGAKYIFVNRINQIIDKYMKSEDKE